MPFRTSPDRDLREDCQGGKAIGDLDSARTPLAVSTEIQRVALPMRREEDPRNFRTIEAVEGLCKRLVRGAQLGDAPTPPPQEAMDLAETALGWPPSTRGASISRPSWTPRASGTCT